MGVFARTEDGRKENEIYEGYPLMANSSTLLVRCARSMFFILSPFPRRSDGCASWPTRGNWDDCFEMDSLYLQFDWQCQKDQLTR